MRDDSFWMFLFSPQHQSLRDFTISHTEYDDLMTELQQLLRSPYFDLTTMNKLQMKNLTEVITIMAKSQKSRHENRYAKWRGFVNMNLTESDAKKFYKWLEELGDDWVGVLATELTEHGLKMSIQRDERSDCWMVMLRCDDPDAMNAGLAVSSRSTDVFEAQCMCLFKHIVLMKRDWNDYFSQSPNFTWG